MGFLALDNLFFACEPRSIELQPSVSSERIWVLTSPVCRRHSTVQYRTADGGVKGVSKRQAHHNGFVRVTCVIVSMCVHLTQLVVSRRGKCSKTPSPESKRHQITPALVAFSMYTYLSSHHQIRYPLRLFSSKQWYMLTTCMYC